MCTLLLPRNITSEDEKIITHKTSGGSQGGGKWQEAEGKKAKEAKVVKDSFFGGEGLSFQQGPVP